VFAWGHHRNNERLCRETELTAAKGEESRRVLNVLIVEAQESIEASRALISKIDAILRIKRADEAAAPDYGPLKNRVKENSRSG
jgi:hypothetical protein